MLDGTRRGVHSRMGSEAARALPSEMLQEIKNRIIELPKERQQAIFRGIAEKALAEIAKTDPAQALSIIEDVIREQSDPALRNEQSNPHRVKRIRPN